MEDNLKWQATQVLRCAYGAALWLAVVPDEDAGMSKPGMSKEGIIWLLDSTRARDPEERQGAVAKLESLVPSWLRDPLGRIP